MIKFRFTSTDTNKGPFFCFFFVGFGLVLLQVQFFSKTSRCSQSALSQNDKNPSATFVSFAAMKCKKETMKLGF